MLSNEPKPDEEKANTLAAGISSVLFQFYFNSILGLYYVLWASAFALLLKRFL